MDPQRNPFAPQPGDEPDSTNPAGPAPRVPSSGFSDFGKEAANTPAVATPVAGQRIEPEAVQGVSPMQAGNTAFGSSGPAAPAPGQPGSTPAAISGLDAPEIPQQHAPGPQSEPEAPASVGEPVDPLPVGLAKHRKKACLSG